MRTDFSSGTGSGRSNPYAPPQAETQAPDESKEADDALNQRRTHLRRESSIRMTGALSLILTAIAVLTLVLRWSFELPRPDSKGGGISQSVQSNWFLLPALGTLVVVACALTSWGLFRLGNWARWALTILVALPPSGLATSWILLSSAQDRPWDYVPDRAKIALMLGLTVLSCLPQLLVMWSKKSHVVFSAGYRLTIRQTPDLRPGRWGILPAMFLAPAALFSSFMAMMTAVLVLAMFGVVRPP
jgi:hypothetical protein